MENSATDLSEVATARQRAALVAAAVLVAGIIAAGVLLPMARPPSAGERVEPAAAEEAVMLAEVHQDHPLHRMLTLTYDVRRLDPASDTVPAGCDERDARRALIVTGRTLWFAPVTKTLVGCGGMSTQ